MIKNSKKGFTLIELVMVIVILGILSAIALPTFVNLQEDAKKAALKGALGSLRGAVSIWYVKTAASSGTGSYPTVAQLSSCPGGPMQYIFPANPYTSSTKVNA
ncbi:MAG: type II secretion system protein, partial [Candidatus Omnitrophota bacterium]|nr:type II secretion system protein [Candidatus Omnitrophota bacterium]